MKPYPSFYELTNILLFEALLTKPVHSAQTHTHLSFYIAKDDVPGSSISWILILFPLVSH